MQCCAFSPVLSCIMVAADDGSLEQFTLLAKTARGRACVALIQQVLSNKKLFVFGELLDMPNVKALAESDQADLQGHARLLAIFAHGRYLEYVRQKEDPNLHIPELNPAQALKLRKLTVVSLCQEHKLVPYRILMGELQIGSVREVEDIVIETIYSGLVEGKLDQKNERFESSYAAGRDVQPTDIDVMIERLTQWQEDAKVACRQIETILSNATLQEEQEAQLDAAIKKTVSSVRLQAKDRPVGSDLDPELMWGDGPVGGGYPRSSGKRRMGPATTRKVPRV
ncbi:COP9 signalosome complex subunit 7a [Aphanomyces cochlioides]|nr:COP9 signalosome complex subunit 7a [Aphanomyces cochlioides]